MASKKKPINLLPKLNYKKPVKNAKKAVEDIARIRNNERAQLNRLKGKFKATNKKGEADALRKQIKAKERSLSAIQGTISTIRKSNTAINNIKAETKSLRLKNAAIKRQLKGLGGKKNAEARAQLNKQYHRNANAIHSKEALINEQLYQVNKLIGQSPESVAKALKLSKRYLEKNHPEDFEEEYFADYIEELTGVSDEPTEEDQIKEAIEEEVVGEDWIVEMHGVFWEVWQNFDKVETYRTADYDKVIFEFSNVNSELAGTSHSLIDERAKAAWAWANDQPPYVYAIKSVTKDRKKLKYNLYQQ